MLPSHLLFRFLGSAKSRISGALVSVDRLPVPVRGGRRFFGSRLRRYERGQLSLPTRNARRAHTPSLGSILDILRRVVVVVVVAVAVVIPTSTLLGLAGGRRRRRRVVMMVVEEW